jgi:hypothetical protein
MLKFKKYLLCVKSSYIFVGYLRKYGFSFLLTFKSYVMRPNLITLSVLVENCIESVSFIAEFGDGVVKMLNRKRPYNNMLFSNDGEVLSPDTCALYHRDWSDVPALGDWDKHYPYKLAKHETA